jgi:cobalamin transport system substrate-binding protein
LGERVTQPGQGAEVRIAWLIVLFSLGCSRAVVPAPDDSLKLLALAPGLAELVAEAGAADLLVARTLFSDYPKEITSLPSVGSGLDPDVEAVLGEGVNTVLMLETMREGKVAETLGSLGLSLVFIRLQTPDDVSAGLRAVGKLTKRTQAAEAAVTKLEANLAAATANLDSPRRVIMLHGRQPLYAAGPSSWGDWMLRLAGHENVLDDSYALSTRLELEDLVVLAPEVIVDTSGLYNAGASQILPVKCPILELKQADISLLRPGPRFPEAVSRLRAILAAP